MAEEFHLKNAPITEAVIDFRVQVSQNFNLELFKEAEFRVGYGKAEDIRSYQFAITQNPDEPPKTAESDLGLIGYRFNSQDGKHVVQFRKDGFTFSRLRPYINWLSVRTEVERLYKIYFEISAPAEASRVAVRYINRLPIPRNDVGDFSAFLAAKLPIPNCGIQTITGFLTQIQIAEENPKTTASITQYVQEDGSDAVPVILDIDVFEVGNFKATPAEILGRLAPLRERKNRYFYASLTDKAIELFK